MNDFSFEDFSPENEPEYEVTLDQLRKDAEEVTELETIKSELEAQVKDLNERIRHITEKRMPYAMQQIGVPEFKLNDGSKVKLYEGVTASQLDPGKAYFEFAKNYLVEHNAADILKTNVSMDFGKGSHNEVLSLVEGLKEQGYDPLVSEKVHAQTYKSFGNQLFAEYNEKIERGEAVEEPPFSDLGMFVVKCAKITKGKK